jgi:hypothetical protein
MTSYRVLAAFFSSTLVLALWLLWKQVEAVAVGESSYVWLYMTVAFLTSATALLAYSVVSRKDSPMFLPLTIVLATVAVPLGLLLLSQGRHSQVSAMLVLAGAPLVLLVLHQRATRQSSYAELFRQVKCNGVRVTRFWADMLRRSQLEPYLAFDGQNYPRIRYGDEEGMSLDGPCRHCAAAPGQYHALTCEAERCPKCHAQRFSCDCDCQDCTLQFDALPDAMT